MACGTTLAGLLATGGVAHAAGSHAFIVADSCTDVAVSVVYSPGLRTSKDEVRHALLSGVISGCSDIYTGPTAGSGSISATLVGKASFDSENFQGTFTVTWPASTGLNPSTGTLSVTDAGGIESVVGTVTGGADNTGALDVGLITTAHSGRGTKKNPVTSQLFTDTEPLTVSENVG